MINLFAKQNYYNAISIVLIKSLLILSYSHTGMLIQINLISFIHKPHSYKEPHVNIHLLLNHCIDCRIDSLFSQHA